jgi:hypothetical protein
VEEADQYLPEIVGDIFEENLFDSNIHQDLDIVVYTECTEGRPMVVANAALVRGPASTAG